MPCSVTFSVQNNPAQNEVARAAGCQEGQQHHFDFIGSRIEWCMKNYVVDNHYSPMIFNVPIQKNLSPNFRDAIPAMLLLAKTIQGQVSRLLSVLFDSGGTRTMIHQKCLPPGTKLVLLHNKQIINTILGQFSIQQEVVLENITLPDLTGTNNKQHTFLTIHVITM